MYSPHTVTLIIPEDNGFNSVVLRGVFLDLSKRANVNRSGLSDADAATLFIPFSVDSSGKTYITPKDYERTPNKADFWTIFDDDDGCYFIKGEQASDLYPYGKARDTHDYCYRVSSVDLRDFGSEDMQHWQVGGR